ncbi:glycosyltransferase 87 family protein [Propionicicella superfundia]|uniref:glycosyltransferase 87 family protein n=1 Tax=Propionicicella superfundia TaxID=348582 RepID=UPI0004110548|nr:glycosyltransferase 87 family protein [Propionicicella superfundia]
MRRRPAVGSVPSVAMVLAWIGTRVALGAEAIRRIVPPGDLSYFVSVMQRWDTLGIQGALREYPTPAAYLFRALWLAGGGHRIAFGVLFVCVMGLLDTVFTIVLWRTARPANRQSAVGVWILFAPLLGAIVYLRFDLVPAVLAAVAVLVFARRPALSGAAVGVGAAVKLWPALLVLPLVGRRASRRRVLVAFLATGVGLAVASVLTGGLSRLVSPLGYQSDRGLHIESVFATPVMLLWAAGSTSYEVALTTYHAYEITGPYVGVLEAASTAASAAALLFIAWLAYRAIRAAVSDPAAIALLALVTTSVMMVSNKVLSPQYMLWLGPVLVALLAVHEPAAAPSRRELSSAALRHLTLLILVATTLTHVFFPLSYGHLFRHSASSLGITGLLAARNAILVGLTGYASFLAVRVTRPGARVALAGVAK